MSLEQINWKNYTIATERMIKYADEALIHICKEENVDTSIYRGDEDFIKKVITRVMEESAVSVTHDCSDFGYGDVLKAVKEVRSGLLHS